MARINDVFVTGTFGNIVFYRRMGKPCARIKRDSIKQTAATKKRGVNFGIAARAGKALRTGLTAAMPRPADRSMQSRFSGAIAKWLGQSDVNSLKACDKIPFLNSFAFTEGEPFPERFRVPVSVNLGSKGVSVSIPAFIPARHISSPAGTVSVKLMIAVAAANLSKGTSSGFQSQIIDIPFNKEEIPAKILDFSVPTVKGTIIVTAARLVYTGLKNNYPYIIDKQKFKPAGVINAAYC